MNKKISVLDEMRRMQGEMDSLFENFFDWVPQWGPKRMPLLEGGKGKGELLKSEWKLPLTDLYETETEVVARVEIPGVNKEDIKINASDESVEIQVEKEAEKEVEDKEKGLYSYERSYKGFYRCMALPDKIDVNKITTKYENGILELKMPKVEPKKKNIKEIKVS